MRFRRLSTVCLSLLALFAWVTPAWSGVPGNGGSIDERQYDMLLHVCADDRDVVCVEREPGEPGPFTGAECEEEGLVPECEPKKVPQTKIAGTMVIGADDAAPNLNGIGVNLLYKFRVNGEGDVATISETFGPDSPIGNWNAIQEELEIFGLIGEWQIMDGTLQPFADELTRLVAAWCAVNGPRDLPPSVPVITKFKRVESKFDSDHSDGGDPLGSSASYLSLIHI